MLVLARKLQQSIILRIPANSEAAFVKVTLLNIFKNHEAGNPRARLGIEAPQFVAVHREEVDNAIQRDLAEQGDPYDEFAFDDDDSPEEEACPT